MLFRDTVTGVREANNFNLYSKNKSYSGEKNIILVICILFLEMYVFTMLKFKW